MEEKEIQAKEGLRVGAVLALAFDRSATGAVKNYQSRRIKDIERKKILNLGCRTNQIARMSAEDEAGRKKRRNRGQKEDIHRLQVMWSVHPAEFHNFISIRSRLRST